MPQGMTEKDARRNVRGSMMKELELNDTERRIKEAEATIAQLKEPFTKARNEWEEKKAADARKAEAAAKSPLPKPSE